MSAGEFHWAMFGAGVILTVWLIDNRDRRWAAFTAALAAVQLALALAN